MNNKIKSQIKEIEDFLYNETPSGWIHSIQMHGYKSEIKDIKNKRELDNEDRKILNEILATVRDWKKTYKNWDRKELKEAKNKVKKLKQRV